MPWLKIFNVLFLHLIAAAVFVADKFYPLSWCFHLYRFFCSISGLINIPAVAFGIFSGGLIMKKFRIGVLGAAKLSLGSSFFGYLLLLSLFAMGCENSGVAGLTVSYHGYTGKAMLQQKGLLKCKPLPHFIPQSIYCWKESDWPEYASQKFDSNQWKPLHSSGCCVMTLSW